MAKISDADRRLIGNHAANLNCAYLISREGAVHYHGKLPGTDLVGWFFVSHDAKTFADDIRNGRA